MALRWDGTTWSLQAPPAPAGSLMTVPRAVSCIASRGCEAVGLFKNASSTIVPLALANWRSAMPTVTTKAATGVGEKTATLNGTVNPNGSETKTYFEYGTTTAYGSKTPEANVGSGTSAVERNVAVAGLSPNTTYHYRIVANNENPETSRGADGTFTTIGPPGVTTGAGVPDETGEAATLNATVDPNGQSTTYQFEYGTAPGSYTTTVPIPAASAGSEMEGKPVSQKITGLTKGTKYYFRVTATNAGGKTDGTEASFTTPGPPSAATWGSMEIGRKSAALVAVVGANGLKTKYHFEYGQTASYGFKAPASPVEFGPEPAFVAAKEPISGLKEGTLYHFRVVAENSLGTTYGEDRTFTTLAPVTLKAKGSALAVGAPLKVFSSNLTFSKEGATRTCAETEFSGEVSENPGAFEAVTTMKMQNAGGAACGFGFVTVKYSTPTKGITLEYTVNGSGEGVARLSKFVLVGSVYWGGSKVADCEYNLAMSGVYAFEPSLLQFQLSGETEPIKGGGACPPAEAVSGEFTVSSLGQAVAAKV
jgi:hypothetical protein